MWPTKPRRHGGRSARLSAETIPVWYARSGGFHGLARSAIKRDRLSANWLALAVVVPSLSFRLATVKSDLTSQVSLDIGLANSESMEEALRTVRLLHQVVIAVGASLLAFALSPDESTSLQKTLGELYALQELDLSKYATWVVTIHTDDLNQKAILETPGTVANDLSTHLSDDFKYKPAFYLEWPDGKATLPDWDRFMRLATIVRFEPELPLKVELPAPPELLDQSMSERPHLQSLLIQVAPEEAMVTDAFDLYLRLAKTNKVTTDGKFQLTFEKDLFYFPEEIVGSVKLIPSWTERRDFAIQWVMSLPHLCERLYHAKPAALVGKGDNVPVFLPEVRKYWFQMAHLPLTEVIEKMEKRAENATHTLTFFSISLNAVLLRWAGPLATILFLAYLVVHLRQLEGFPVRRREDVASFPWIGVFPDWISVALLIVTLFALPLISNGLVLWRTTSGTLRVQALAVTTILLLGMQGYMARTLYRIRRRI